MVIKKELQSYTRKAVFANLKDFCPLGSSGSYVEVTAWKNGEGVDVIVNSHQCTMISLTYGELKAIEYSVKQINK